MSLDGEIQVAPDKSISHRALMLTALAEGSSEINNLLVGEDVLCTLRVLQQLGVVTSAGPECLSPVGALRVRGVGLKGLKTPDQVLYCGNSGTTMRLMLGMLCGSNIAASLTGDDSLNRRPMERITKPLGEMGGQFEVMEEEGRRIVRVQRHDGLRAIHYHSPVASAQIKSSLLLAGLCAGQKVSITEPAVSRNHTELMLSAMGAPLEVSGTTVTLSPTQGLRAMDFVVPGDISSAAFFMVAGLICPDSEILIRSVNLNPTRTGLIDVLLQMGAALSIENRHTLCGESAGDIRVRTSRLVNVPVSGDMIPRLIDEVPILALAAACAEGEFVLSDARELRVKETDRIRAIATELGKLGVSVSEKTDGLVIRGGRALSVKTDKMCSFGDHRMAMMLVIAQLFADKNFTIDDTSCIATSFPGFFDVVKRIQKSLQNWHIPKN